MRSGRREEPRSIRGVVRMSRVDREEERFSIIRIRGGREREEEDRERDDRRRRGWVAARARGVVGGSCEWS